MDFVERVEQCRPELFDLLTLDESYDRVDWDRVIARLRTHPHEASWFVPGSASTVRHGGYYGSMMNDEDGDDDGDDDGGGDALVGWTALHTAMYVDPTPEGVEALLGAFPRAARMESFRGDTPLHFARFAEVEPGVVRALLRAAPSAVFAKNNEGYTPLDEFCRWWVNHINEERRGGVVDDDVVADEQDLDVSIGVGRERDMQWHKIELMLRAAAVVRSASEQEEADGESSSSPDDSRGGAAGSPRRGQRRRRRRRFLPLHVASDLCCPPEVLRHAHFRDTSQVYVRDEQCAGRLPLSIAAASSIISGKSDEESRGVLACLLGLNPSAASAVDAEGRLPLHLALESLLTWEGGVDLIMGAAPRALRTRDVTTYLYPFMTAAVGGPGGMCADLNTIYMLLRNGPEMAAGMADDPPWLRAERRWKMKLEESRKAHGQEVGVLTKQLAGVTLEKKETEKELAEARGMVDTLKDENLALRAELKRMKEDMDVFARIDEEIQKENTLFDSETSCHKRRRGDAND